MFRIIKYIITVERKRKMKLHLKEAESDYVRIGNMVLPKNASDFGYADYNTVAAAGKRNYEAEKEKERQAKIKAEKRAKGQVLYDKFVEIVDNTTDENKRRDQIDDLLIPNSGKCETKAGELMRALQRLLYRKWNDGDMFYCDYGLETCASSAAYLMDESTGHIYDILRDIMDDLSEDDTRYDKALKAVEQALIKYLYNNPELFGEPCEDSRDYRGGTYDMIQDAGHSYEFEISTDYFEQYGIDRYDIQSFVEGCAEGYPGAKVEQQFRDVYVITNLTHEDYLDLDRNYGRWEEEFISEYAVDEEEEDWEEE